VTIIASDVANVEQSAVLLSTVERNAEEPGVVLLIELRKGWVGVVGDVDDSDVVPWNAIVGSVDVLLDDLNEVVLSLVSREAGVGGVGSAPKGVVGSVVACGRSVSRIGVLETDRLVDDGVVVHGVVVGVHKGGVLVRGLGEIACVNHCGCLVVRFIDQTAFVLGSVVL